MLLACACGATVSRGAVEVSVLAVDRVGLDATLPPAADLLSITLHDPARTPRLRVSFLSCAAEPVALGGAKAQPTDVPLRITATPHGGVASMITDMRLTRDGDKFVADDRALRRAGDPDAVWIDLAPSLLRGAGPASPVIFTVETLPGETVTASYPPDKVFAANCALVLHGNQGLGYSEVFAGRSEDLEGSGFDEALQVHEGTGVPGNFHLSGPLQSSAEWSRNSGDPVDFNGWLAAGVSAGWAGMITSAYAQHIMPFVANDMNDWAVSIESDMIGTRYGYTPRVAWVPERVWLNTSGYPSAGVNDWIGDNFQGHDVWGVILDDDVHLAGHDNHQIHFLDANGLRLVPRDRSFTGNIVGGNGQASLDILTGLANSGVGEYRIAVLAEDWEAIAEMGGWAVVTPNAKEAYDWIVGKCDTESAWLSTWKLADALTNPNFNGDTFSPTPGTYGEIGGFDGYGGGDNGWYTHWAGYIPWANGGDGDGICAGAGGNCKNYGTLWSEAFGALMAAPDNNVSQAGWYVLMTNLYETAWHDGMGGDISGWEHRYSSHIKNAMIYAEAAHWLDGDYAATTACFFSDIDNDGYDEVVMHNDRLFAVIEGVGGRVTHLFVKGPGYGDTAIGSDNVNWNGDGDYNDANHVGAFSDVGPNYQHDVYGLEIVQGSGTTVVLKATHAEVTKEITLVEGDAFLEAVYRVGSATHWLQAGFSPSLVDLIWNADMDRVWPADAAYMGRRNPNTGIAAAWVLGTAGATHQLDFSGTLMRGDEVKAAGAFAVRLYAGLTGAPDGGGDIAELRAVANDLTDTLGPLALSADYYPTTDRLVIGFDQPADPASLVPAGVGLDEDGDDLAEVALGAGTTVLETTPAYALTLQLDASDAAAVEALDPAQILLLMASGTVADAGGVPNDGLTAADEVGVAIHAATLMTIDGRLDAGEWDGYLALPDSNDSAWTASNELDGLYVAWDADYLYVAIDGIVHTNSWLLYVDVDPGGPGGETDLTAIDTWERGVLFTAPGFRADFQYGCYQHQSAWDGDSFWEITTATAASDRTGEIISAHDAAHAYGAAGASELAIPWDVLYELGAGHVPVGAQLGLVASICWDPEPDGELGGDSVPNNAAALLPTIDTVWTFTVDDDGDGLPDSWGGTAVPSPAGAMRLWPPHPNPFNPQTRISFELPDGAPSHVTLSVYTLRGERVTVLVDGALPAGRHAVAWRGTSDDGRPLAAGTYVCRLEHGGRATARTLTLVK
ncbi:hypothetical protein KKA85_14015 [bacterium]|nr:hypothetical protein [bacterium]